jgi:hypothetical protein
MNNNNTTVFTNNNNLGYYLAGLLVLWNKAKDGSISLSLGVTSLNSSFSFMNAMQ